MCGTFTVSHASLERIGIRKVTRAENLHLLLLTYCSLSCRNPCECVKPKSSFISGQGRRVMVYYGLSDRFRGSWVRVWVRAQHGNPRQDHSRNEKRTRPHAPHRPTPETAPRAAPRHTHTHTALHFIRRAQACVGGRLNSVHFARFASYCAGVQVFICNACICGISSERASCTLRVGGRPWSQSVVARLRASVGRGRGPTAALGGGGNSHPVSFE